jgi:hypothetical protein
MKRLIFFQQMVGAMFFALVFGGCSVSSTAPTPVPVPATPIAGVGGVRAFGDTLWAWSENEIWHYPGNEWSIYAIAPTRFNLHNLDMEFALDTLWVTDGYRLQYSKGGAWQIAWQVVPGSPPVGLRIDVDNQSGIVWMTTGDNLYRWNGEVMTDVGRPSIPNIGDIAVTGDGFLWSSGWDLFVPNFGGLASYDDANSTWEMVRPWRKDEDVPAHDLATTPKGDLWVILANWFEDRKERLVEGKPEVEWALAHRDVAT